MIGTEMNSNILSEANGALRFTPRTLQLIQTKATGIKMARQEHVLTVFVASPSDVDDERGKLEDVIRELNIAWSRELGIRLDLVRWETHAYPGMGVDAQDVINEQIPDDYDMFVGIMWCRYGTQTARAGSGTIEEFDRAKKKHDSDSSSIKLMMYFKDEAIPPSRLDPTQLIKVNEFRDSLGDEGALYWKFSGIDQFEQLIRLHLTRQVQAWKARLDNSDFIQERTTKADKDIPTDDDDQGILDLIETFEDKFEELTSISTRIGEATEQLGENMEERTREMEKIPKNSKGNSNRKAAKRLIGRAASDMKQYTARIEAELPLFSDAMNVGVNSLIRAATMSIDLRASEEDAEEIQDGLEAITSLQAVLGSSNDSTKEFRETVAALPRMTTDLNRAKRGVTNAIDQLLDEFSNGQTLLTESEKVIRQLLEQASNNESRS